MAARQRAVLGGEITHVVLDREWRVIPAVEAYLEHLRQEGYSPSTVRAYAQGLASWWSMLEERALDWTRVGVSDLVRFQRRSRGAPEAASGLIDADGFLGRANLRGYADQGRRRGFASAAYGG